MAEQLGGSGGRYIKFGKVASKGELPAGSKVKGILTDITWDRPGTFGPESHLHLDTAQGPVMVRISSGLTGTIKGSQGRFIFGKTELEVTYTGEQVNPKSGRTFKAFTVEAEGLAPKGTKPAEPTEAEKNVAAARAAFEQEDGSEADIPF